MGLEASGLPDGWFEGFLWFRVCEEGEAAGTAEGDEVELVCLLSRTRHGGMRECYRVRAGARMTQSCRDETAP
jgi:hypothetical protein